MTYEIRSDTRPIRLVSPQLVSPLLVLFLLVLFLLVGMLGSAAPARAAFHLWIIAEVYSNENGSVQFIELSTGSNGQHVLDNHNFSVKQGNSILDFVTYSGNLPSSATAAKRFLMATESLAELPNGVMPDYLIPEGFIDLESADNVDFANLDTLSLEGLPLDGVNSLNRGQGSLPATPENFAGEIGDVPEPSAAVAAATVLVALAWLARMRSRAAATVEISSPRWRRPGQAGPPSCR